MKTYRWLLRRELWENRAIWLIPVVIAVALVFAALFGRVDVMEDVPSRTFGGMLLLLVGILYFLVFGVYSSWYLLDCLYSDRRDKSVLFWKSLPISDSATVLSKLAMALIVIPVVYFVVSDVSVLLTAFIVSVRAHSILGGALWSPDLWLQLQVLWIYLIVVSAIWFLPLAGYLLLISASARRAVMLWSILPPLALGLIERWFFGTHVIFREVSVRLAGFPAVAFRPDPNAPWTGGGEDLGRALPSVWNMIDLQGFFSSPQTLVGVAVGAGLIFCAIQVRSRRAEI
jgi:ABC-2 type transport system permease protein